MKHFFSGHIIKILRLQMLLWLFLSLGTYVSAQKKSQGAKNPFLWIEAMRDTSANYYEAVESFEAFWANKERPVEKEMKENPAGDEETDAEVQKYTFQYRRFKIWQMVNHSFIHNDGRIFTPSERLKLWQEQKKVK